MIAIVLASAVACQNQDPGMDRAHRDRADRDFDAAVEETVARLPGSRPPEPFRALFLKMASEKWKERDEASKAALEAVRRDPPAIRWLYWGRASRDLEVALRCNGAIRRALPCPLCRGAGFHRNDDGYEHECWGCNGMGSLWWRGMWD